MDGESEGEKEALPAVGALYITPAEAQSLAVRPWVAPSVPLTVEFDEIST
jgi:hypothetical protein